MFYLSEASILDLSSCSGGTTVGISEQAPSCSHITNATVKLPGVQDIEKEDRLRQPYYAQGTASYLMLLRSIHPERMTRRVIKSNVESKATSQLRVVVRLA